MKKTTADFFDNKRKLILVLIILSALLYLKSLLFGFSPMDEQWLIVNNSDFLKKWSNLNNIFSMPTLGFYYRPLFMLTFMTDYHIGGASPFYYHLSNLIFHIISLLLLFRFLILWEVKTKPAFLLSVLFAVHPLMLQAVAWIPGRNDLLLCIFTLSSLITLTNYFQNKKIISLCLHFLFFICALLTKENAIVLPVIFAALYFAGEKFEKRNFILLMFGWTAVAVFWYLLRKNIINYLPPVGEDIFQSAKNFGAANLNYIGKTLLPVQQSVFPTLKNSSLLPGILSSIAFILLCFKPGLKNKKIAFLGIGIFFGMLAIPIWFGTTSSSGEHYEQRAYTSMAGLCLFLSQLKINTNSKIFSYCAAILLLFLTVKTFLRMDVYKDELSFADTGTKEAPDYFFFYAQKANMLYYKGDFTNAISNYDKAILYRSNVEEYYNNRGHSLNALRKHKEAIEDFNHVIAGPKFVSAAFLGRCKAFYSTAQTFSAMNDLLVLRRCCSEIIPPDLNKVVQQKWDEEMAVFNKQIEADPKNANLFFTRGKVFIQSGLYPEAFADIKKAAELDPLNKEYKMYLDSAPPEIKNQK